ncbi:MAG: glycoside hydrolase family 3 C-terminal domain-containing protein [Acidobacteria bacterium]|nr:glycoside hydrolase family 3 C-terminal domain-containing protein [Acidobacteriota bacterium]
MFESEHHRREWLFVLLLGVAACAACGGGPSGPGAQPEQQKWVAATLARLSRAEKVGQMIVVRTYGDFLNWDTGQFRHYEQMVTGWKVGGFVLGNRMDGTAVQPAGAANTAAFLNQMQSLADVPLLVAADMERGAGMRLAEATRFPSPMALAGSGDPESVFQMARATGEEARAAGVNWVLAPVADVNSNPRNPIINVRAFGERPEVVSRYVSRFVQGAHAANVLATAKHFPGHGSTDRDSHSSLPIVRSDRNTLEQENLPPFRAAIEAGVDAVMTAHVVVPALEADAAAGPESLPPATLSKAVLTDLLREQLHFDGLIVTDALEMQALTAEFSSSEVVLRAVEAGADVLLLPPDPEAAIRAIVAAIESGRIDESRIDRSVERILEAKARLGLHLQKLADLEQLPAALASPEHLSLAEELSVRSLVLLEETADLVPLKTKNVFVLVLAETGNSDQGKVFLQEISQRLPSATSLRLEPYFAGAMESRAIQLASEADAVVCAVFIDAAASKGTVALEPVYQQLLRKLAGANSQLMQQRFILVALGSPYFLAELSVRPPASLLTFDAFPLAERSAVRALFGETRVTGRLPVTIPGVATYGAGLVRPASMETGPTP